MKPLSQGDADVGFDFRQGEEVFRDPSLKTDEVISGSPLRAE